MADARIEAALPTWEQINAWETRVMSVGHGVLTDTEWRQIMDGYERMWDALRYIAGPLNESEPQVYPAAERAAEALGGWPS